MSRKQSKHAMARVWPAMAMMAIWLAGAAGGLAADAPAAAPAADETVVLDHSTLWRFFRVRDAVQVRYTNGVLARAALSGSGHVWQPDGWDANGTSPVPPADWAGPEFDDSVWPRERLPQPSAPAVNVRNQSGSTGPFNLFDTVVVLTRAQFMVKDPAKVKSCRLDLEYWGGLIVYINGREAVRRNILPGGTNLLDTVTGGAVVPLWFTVRVPKTVAPGTYEGTVTLSAEGLAPTAVKLQVNVCDWVMPDPKDFRIQNFLYNAEEVAAMHYGVTNYSDRHFELVGKSLALLAEVNSRQVHANLAVRFAGRGNPESLVRWIKQPDGSFKHDFTAFDKCLAMVATSIGTPNTLRWNCWTGPVTVVDPTTGKVTSMDSPGGEEGYRFWKPVFDEMLRKIKARGWLDQTTLGCNLHSGVPSPGQVDLAHKLWPEGEWSWTSHAAGEGAKFVGTFEGGDGKTGYDSRAMRIALGAESVDRNKVVLMTVRQADGVWMVTPRGKLPPLWALDGPRRNTYCNTVRHVINDNSALREVRRLVEFGALYLGYDGVSEFGADVFPVKRPVGGYGMPPISEGANWGNPNSTLALLYPSPDGPVTTERFEMFREGVELCEASIFVGGALHRNLLSADLKARAERYLGERRRTFALGFFVPRYRQATEDAKLLDLAGEVARELAQKK